MELRFLGHACFLLDDGKTKIITDPFLSGNPFAAVAADEITADMIFVTHGHGDHVGDSVEIAKRCDCEVCCTVDLSAGVFEPASISTVVGNLGGWIPTRFGKAKFVPAIHGSGVPGCLCCGFIFDIGGKKIYHAGDTALTMDMALLEDEQIDIALLPIGDVYTMGPADALRAAKLIKPKLVIPMHYNTMPPIVQDAQAFVDSVKSAGIDAVVLAPGESLTL